VGRTEEWNNKENPGINKRIIFELILAKWSAVIWTELISG
jgi:hypothetical protein